LRSAAPPTRSTRGIYFPVDPSTPRINPFRFRFDLVAGFHPRFVPPSSFVRDLDGLPLPGLCDLFQPLTPMGFCFPFSPAVVPFHAGLSTFVFRNAAARSSVRRPLPAWRGGWAPCCRLPTGSFHLAACAARFPVPPLRPSRRPFRLRLPSAFTFPRCPPGHRDDLSCGVQSFPVVPFPAHPVRRRFPFRSEDRSFHVPPGWLPLRVCPCDPV
jgi:hypothetical protein